MAGRALKISYKRAVANYIKRDSETGAFPFVRMFPKRVAGGGLKINHKRSGFEVLKRVNNIYFFSSSKIPTKSFIQPKLEFTQKSTFCLPFIDLLLYTMLI